MVRTFGRYGPVQYLGKSYGTKRYGAGATIIGTIWYGTVRYGTVPICTVPLFRTVPYKALDSFHVYFTARVETAFAKLWKTMHHAHKRQNCHHSWSAMWCSSPSSTPWNRVEVTCPPSRRTVVDGVLFLFYFIRNRYYKDLLKSIKNIYIQKI